MSGKEPHLGDQEGTGVQDVPRTPQDAAAATAPLPADLFPEHAPSMAPPLTCQRALQHATQDRTQLYLTCLPPELREAVDRLLRCFAPAWHFSGALAPLDLSEFGVKNASEVQYAVRSNGERLLLALVSGKTHLVHISRPRDHPQRVVILVERQSIIDLRPAGDVCFLSNCGPSREVRMRLRDAEGALLAEWMSEVGHPHSVQFLEGNWVICRGTVCHLARRDRVLRCAFVASREHSAFAWGAEGRERMCIVDKQQVSVWALSTGDASLIYTNTLTAADLEMRAWWHPVSPAGALLKNAMPDTKATHIYPLATGAPLVHTTELSACGMGGTEVQLLEKDMAAATSLYFWSARDPHRTQSVALGDWRLFRFSESLFVFRSGNEYLFWVWGSQTAVRTADLASLDAKHILSVEMLGGAAFVSFCDLGGSGLHSLYMLPLLGAARAPGAPPPLTLPSDNAPLVSASRLYRGARRLWLSEAAGAEAGAVLAWSTNGTICYLLG